MYENLQAAALVIIYATLTCSCRWGPFPIPPCCLHKGSEGVMGQ